MDVDSKIMLRVEFHHKVTHTMERILLQPVSCAVLMKASSSAEFCLIVGGAECRQVRWRVPEGEVGVKVKDPSSLSAFTEYGRQATTLYVWFKDVSPATSRDTTPEKKMQYSGNFVALACFLFTVLLFSQFTPIRQGRRGHFFSCNLFPLFESGVV